MIFGAFGIRNFGGAFEANKLFTGILAIPVGIPLVLGIVAKTPTQNSSVYTIVVGVILGIILNMLPQISWEIGTLIEIVVCLAVYFYPAFCGKRDYSAGERELFAKIETPIPESEKPEISKLYIRSIVRLFVFSMVVSGLLFGGTSLPSVGEKGGLYGVVAAVLCIVSAGGVYAVCRRFERE